MCEAQSLFLRETLALGIAVQNHLLLLNLHQNIDRSEWGFGDILLTIVDIFNNSYLEAQDCRPITQSFFTLVFKHDKYGFEDASYRLITLLPYIFETLEGIIKCRIELLLEHNQLLPSSQYMFR